MAQIMMNDYMEEVAMSAQVKVYALIVSGRSGQSAQKAADKNIRTWLNSQDARILLTKNKPEVIK